MLLRLLGKLFLGSKFGAIKLAIGTGGIATSEVTSQVIEQSQLTDPSLVNAITQIVIGLVTIITLLKKHPEN